MAAVTLGTVILPSASLATSATLPRWRDVPIRAASLAGGTLELPLGCKVEYGEGIDSTIGDVLCTYKHISIAFDVASLASVDFGSKEETPAHPGWLRQACSSRKGERLWCRTDPPGQHNACSAEAKPGVGSKYLALTAQFPLLGPATFRLCARDEDAAKAALEIIAGYTRPKRPE